MLDVRDDENDDDDGDDDDDEDADEDEDGDEEDDDVDEYEDGHADDDHEFVTTIILMIVKYVKQECGWSKGEWTKRIWQMIAPPDQQK
eukprot:m.124257 g.124257  ORF g.124257 m.124257 type:complete len:88 (+) comp29050_c0_seq1:303-566(+)